MTISSYSTAFAAFLPNGTEIEIDEGGDWWRDP